MPLPPPLVLDLIERFDRNRDAYKSPGYNETQLRREFLDPLFKSLGWDIDNEQGFAEPYKDVIHEDAIRVGEATKAPDYCFRIGGARKFFLEAKKPAIDIRQDISPAFQLRRYAWTTRLPLSVLSDFEEFSVYDCRFKPVKTDSAATGRVLYIPFDEYPKRWGDIAEVFSREAVLKGSFDRFAESTRAKRGTADVDEEFLKTIESWRTDLARNLALRNPALSQRELNFAVQRIIDRIIFLRISEGRGIEDYGRLRSLLKGDGIYPRLCQIFEEANARYNSGLFHFKAEKDRHEAPDEFTLGLQLDDKLLRELVHGLYYPESPYVFSALSPDILGQVYEQFLGKVIRLTDGHRAVVEEKPEVKKAGGVYYTPTYVVDYIVQTTVGHLLEGKTPKQAASVKILDPACGSGSFLIGAYEYLLKWHLDYYTGHDPEKWAKGSKPALVQIGAGRWRLTIAERKRILLANIFGVDIDSQAVETTKLSLLLKVLEGETEQTLQPVLRLFHERALPDLGDNIKCGNSLIGPDFYQQEQMPLLDDEQRLRVNVFDWHAEFPDIFKGGGFDAVIGNPPYIFTREQISEVEREYYSHHYKLSWEKHNTFLLFMESMLRLLNHSGRGGYIVPNSWLTMESGQFLRQSYIPRLELVADLNYQVFRNVSMEPCIFIATGHDIESDAQVLRAGAKEDFLSARTVPMKRSHWCNPGFRIVVAGSQQLLGVLDKARVTSTPLGEKFDVRTGLQAYEKGKGSPPQTAKDVSEHVFDRTQREDENSFRYLEGRDVGRYRLHWSGMWMQYGAWLSQPRDIGIFTRPRVLLREITAPPPYCLCATFLSKPFLNNKSILNVLHTGDNEDELKALTAVLNSRLTSVFYKNQAVKGARTIFPKVVIKNLREFPYPREIDESLTKKLAGCTDVMLALHQGHSAAKTPQEKTALERQIAATDTQVDTLIYALYGLTSEEIKIIEAATPQ